MGARWSHSKRDAQVATGAARIHDPIERLRYLRKAAAYCEDRKRRRRFWIRLSPVLLLAVALPLTLARIPGRVEPAVPAMETRTVVERDVRPPEPVWLVETAPGAETYSNGLRVDTRFTERNRPRSYLAFARSGAEAASATPRTEPAGIVFHTTESWLEPFDAGHNMALKRIGESLLDYVRRRRAYHYLIDRFGRVYRLVAETDAANHAGHSVWADTHWVYLNLNDSFLGVSFEGRSDEAGSEAGANPAQIHAATMLTQMLRSRYAIAGSNCVTHAQVSVNPANLLAGYHTDWAGGFPFRELGLPENDAAPLPSITIFGFEADQSYRNLAGARLLRAVELGEAELRERAAEKGRTVAAYRRELRKDYRSKLALAGRRDADE
jgi:hypothetical protein